MGKKSATPVIELPVAAERDLQSLLLARLAKPKTMKPIERFYDEIDALFKANWSPEDIAADFQAVGLNLSPQELLSAYRSEKRKRTRSDGSPLTPEASEQQQQAQNGGAAGEAGAAAQGASGETPAAPPEGAKVIPMRGRSTPANASGDGALSEIDGSDMAAVKSL
jgi:hypothetical protein